MLEIEYEFREEDLVNFNEHRLSNDREMQRKIRQNRLFAPGVMLAIGLFYYVYYVDMMTTAYITLLAIVWAISSPFIMKMDMRRKFFDLYTEAEKKTMFGVHALTIMPECLEEKGPNGKKHKTPWNEFLRVEKHKDYVYIYSGIDTAIVIPRETVKKGDLKAFAKQAEGIIDRLG